MCFSYTAYQVVYAATIINHSTWDFRSFFHDLRHQGFVHIGAISPNSHQILQFQVMLLKLAKNELCKDIGGFCGYVDYGKNMLHSQIEDVVPEHHVLGGNSIGLKITRRIMIKIWGPAQQFGWMSISLTLCQQLIAISCKQRVCEIDIHLNY